MTTSSIAPWIVHQQIIQGSPNEYGGLAREIGGRSGKGEGGLGPHRPLLHLAGLDLG